MKPFLITLQCTEKVVVGLYQYSLHGSIDQKVSERVVHERIARQETLRSACSRIHILQLWQLFNLSSLNTTWLYKSVHLPLPITQTLFSSLSHHLNGWLPKPRHTNFNITHTLHSPTKYTAMTEEPKIMKTYPCLIQK